jgi:hypothetical protein
MNEIKFSHEYLKFPFVNMGECPCRLLEVVKVHYDKLGEEFVKYDTAYWVDPDNVGYYKLPKTDLLLLLLQTHSLTGNSRLFTTIRRWTPKKEDYYRSKIGEGFKIVIAEKLKQEQDG